MPNTPVIKSTRIIAETRLFRVEEMELRFSNGVEVTYERMHGSPYGAVMAVPMIDAATVLLIREYAAGAERYELALPKGRIESGEDAVTAANREMMEEVGYGANKLTLLKSLTEAPGYFRHETHVVVAEDLYPEKHEGDEPEEIEVIPWKLKDLDHLWSHPECTEARTIAALTLVRDGYHRKGHR